MKSEVVAAAAVLSCLALFSGCSSCSSQETRSTQGNQRLTAPGPRQLAATFNDTDDGGREINLPPGMRFVSFTTYKHEVVMRPMTADETATEYTVMTVHQNDSMPAGTVRIVIRERK